MPAGFTRSFAGRLDRYSALDVSEAVDGQPLRSGVVLLARGDTQMAVERDSAGWIACWQLPAIIVSFRVVSAIRLVRQRLPLGTSVRISRFGRFVSQTEITYD